MMKISLKAPLVGWSLLFIAPWALASWVYFKAPIPEFLSPGNPSFTKWLINEVSTQVRVSRFPTEILRGDDGSNEKLKIEYTLDAKLTAQADKLLAQYHPDFAAVVVIDANTGKIKVLSSFEKEPELNENLALRGSFPAASIFKMVTAATAVDKYKSDPDHTILFNGGNHTLYKRNVMSEDVNRWTREVTLRKAFAMSLNTAFARLAIETLSTQALTDYATRFGFNREISGDVKFDSGYTEIPAEKGFHLAELASGFNRITRMSPLQGALMAAVVANDGVMPRPKIIERVTDSDNRVLYEFKQEMDQQVLDIAAVDKMRDLMGATVSQGTSRKSFRSIRKDRKMTELEIGGKTGSLQGLNPKGKTDWFVGYAISPNGERLAVAALTVNKVKWTVKSSELAKQLVKSHFANLNHWIAENR
jgi:penicillin-binding protein A